MRMEIYRVTDGQPLTKRVDKWHPRLIESKKRHIEDCFHSSIDEVNQKYPDIVKVTMGSGKELEGGRYYFRVEFDRPCWDIEFSDFDDMMGFIKETKESLIIGENEITFFNDHLY